MIETSKAYVAPVPKHHAMKTHMNVGRTLDGSQSRFGRQRTRKSLPLSGIELRPFSYPKFGPDLVQTVSTEAVIRNARCKTMQLTTERICWCWEIFLV
jgi:hypothetical protein